MKAPYRLMKAGRAMGRAMETVGRAMQKRVMENSKYFDHFLRFQYRMKIETIVSRERKQWEIPSEIHRSYAQSIALGKNSHLSTLKDFHFYSGAFNADSIVVQVETDN